MRRKRASKDMTPNDGYALPKSAEKGVPFIDWNEVLRESLGINIKKVKKIIKRRRKDE
jgi:hypothetical protein